MCGIAGVLQIKPSFDGEQLGQLVSSMTDALIRRGPDAGGVWVGTSGRVALGHRRLSILDLSPEGAQPMFSPSKRFSVVFNGEIYNHVEIGQQLRAAGFTFRGHSDTEVLVTAIEHWGVEATLGKLVGMFAFAAWDSQEQDLYLARDRLGEKPLYYGSAGDVFFFCSELKSLRVHPVFTNTLSISPASLSLYLQYGYVPDPHSIYAGVSKLLPGAYLKLSCDQDVVGNSSLNIEKLSLRQYWNPVSKFNELSGRADKGISPREAVDSLDHLLRQAVSSQMMADVPLGAFLSGGIDSTTVVAAMQSMSNSPIKTFTIGFSQKEFDEATHAAAIARHLKTDHTELYVTPEDCINVVPLMAQVYDEPFADSSQLPTFLVSKLAKSSVTVSLSGDGGDELFCGYNRYFFGRDVERLNDTAPLFLRRVLASVLKSSSATDIYSGLRMLAKVSPKFGSLSGANVTQRMLRLSSALTASSVDEMYKGLVACWTNPQEVLSQSNTAADYEITLPAFGVGTGSIDRFMLTDLLTYLPGDNLVKVDRAAMYHSLETRVPLLDHRLVEYALSLPVSLKYREGSSKWLLRQVLYRYVPRELIERPKMGFSVPIAVWLRSALRGWAEDLLSVSKLRRSNVFREEVVGRYWREFLAGRDEHAMRLWAVLMFQAWSETHYPA